MAISAIKHAEIGLLACFSLTTADAGRLAAFYESAFGCRVLATERRSGADFEQLMGVAGGAESITLGLGQQRIELLQFDRRGRPYPEGSQSSDLIFLHFAIVAADIDHAYQRLTMVDGWTAISTGGPQRLPNSSGGVTAFKFRDPDGHPLELLAFPEDNVPPYWQTAQGDDPCLGIDHSAISVSDTARSIAFYEALGLRLSKRSVNRGAQQARLDGLEEPVVKITALVPRIATPHLEVLCYQSVARNHGNGLQNNDIAAARLVFETWGRPPAIEGDAVERSAIDPDGHKLLIVPPLPRASTRLL